MRWIACLLGVSTLLLVGCVPQRVHDETRKELEKAKLANADLVRKYNQAIQELTKKDAELAAADPAALRATIRDLESKIRQMEEDGASARFTAGDARRVPGATIDQNHGLVIGSSLLFEEGSNALRPTAKATLDGISEVIREKPQDLLILIEGHTDNQELRVTKDQWKYNMRLAYERGHVVFEYLLGKGIAENRMIVRACSYTVPVDPVTANTEEGRRQNRRVVVRLGGTRI